MKTAFLAFIAVASISTGALAQGTIAAENLNGFGGPTATSFGLFFNADGTPSTTSRINITIIGGPNANSLSPIVTLAGASALFYGGGLDPRIAPGQYLDLNSTTYVVSGVPPGGNATLQVLAWIGDAASFANAPVGSQFWPWNGTSYVNPTTFTFPNRTGGGGATPPLPKSLDGMPAMVLQVPEPSDLQQISLGLVAFLVFLRRTRKS